MRVAVVTMKVKSGRCEENFHSMKEKILQAKKEHADLIVFPQNAISGYLLGDLWKDEAWCSYVDAFNEQIVALSEDIAIVWGNIKYRSHQLFNAIFYAYQGKTSMRVQSDHPQELQQAKYFSTSKIQGDVELQDTVFALNFQDELQIADWNINLDARPFDIHRQASYQGNVIYVNAVGMQNCNKAVVMMDGGSYVCRAGEVCYHAPYGTEDYSVIDLDQPALSSIPKPHVLSLLKSVIRDFDEQVLQQRMPWIIGLSGGLDSSVSAALLQAALGSERVIGYSMSTSYNTSSTKANAKHLADALHIRFYEGNIMPMVEATQSMLQAYEQPQAEGLALENMQARLRGHMLSTFASIHGGVVVNNGNKVENALGYCTLYGDAIGAIGFLGDLTKVQLCDLIREINAEAQKEIIPSNLLPQWIDGKLHWEVAPSAELKDGQKDPMKWFYHDYLVDHLQRDLSVKELLEKYLDQTLLQGELKEVMEFYQLDQPKKFIEDLDWFLQTCRRNQFKHTQVPVIFSVSKNAYALRNEIQADYDDACKALREKILSLV